MFTESKRRGLVVYSGAVLSAILLTAGYAPFSQAWCGWTALIPVALGLFYGGGTSKQAALAGYVLGLIHFGWSLFWLNEVTTAGWAALTLYLALYPAAWCLLWRWIAQPSLGVVSSFLNIRRALLGASAWVVLEWLRGALFTGFPWNYLGVTQHSVIGIIQIAELGGVLLISWLLAFAGLSIGLTAARLSVELRDNPVLKNRWEFTLAMGLAGLSFLYGVRVVFEKTDHPVALHYLAVQPNLPQNPWGGGVSLREAVAKMEVLSVSGMAVAGDSRPELVIWPETPVPDEIYADREFDRLLKSLTVDRACAWLFGSNYFEGNRAFNSAVFFNPGETVPQIYRKNHLVLMGEYTPLADMFPIIRKFTPLGMDFTPGTEQTLFKLRKPAVKIAPLICFEDILPGLARLFAQQGPDLFVNMTNDGWFNQSAQSRQHLANALFRCVEFRVPMLRVTNSGVTALISEKGVVSGILRDAESGTSFTSGVMHGTVQIAAVHPTFYCRHGDWIAGFSLGLILVLAVLDLRAWIGLRGRK